MKTYLEVGAVCRKSRSSYIRREVGGDQKRRCPLEKSIKDQLGTYSGNGRVYVALVETCLTEGKGRKRTGTAELGVEN